MNESGVDLSWPIHICVLPRPGRQLWHRIFAQPRARGTAESDTAPLEARQSREIRDCLGTKNSGSYSNPTTAHKLRSVNFSWPIL